MLYPGNSLQRKQPPTRQFGQILVPTHFAMAQDPKNSRLLTGIRRAAIEVAFIIFLFYSNLLMGEFNRTNGRGKTFAVALADIFTIKNFAIAIIAASIGYVAFEYLRKKP